jgi:hypothetical protein
MYFLFFFFYQRQDADKRVVGGWGVNMGTGGGGGIEFTAILNPSFDA